MAVETNELCAQVARDASVVLTLTLHADAVTAEQLSLALFGNRVFPFDTPAGILVESTAYGRPRAWSLTRSATNPDAGHPPHAFGFLIDEFSVAIDNVAPFALMSATRWAGNQALAPQAHIIVGTTAFDDIGSACQQRR